MTCRNLTMNLVVSAGGPARAPGGVLTEHSLAKLASPLDLPDGRTLPSGSAGAVVGIWASGKAHEIEFLEPFHAVVTVPARVLLPATDAA